MQRILFLYVILFETQFLSHKLCVTRLARVRNDTRPLFFVFCGECQTYLRFVMLMPESQGPWEMYPFVPNFLYMETKKNSPKKGIPFEPI